jgi:chromate reductase, NAD(P)H dehydrogenase (quinone)
MTQIAIIVGSLRAESFNRRLANAIARLAPDDVEFTWPDISGLPLYNQDDDSDPASQVAAFKQEVLAADGVIFVTPEYNRSIPGVLKNAIDHASRPGGKSVWAGKPAGVIGISIGPSGTAMAQQHLRNVLACLDMPTLNQPEVYLRLDDQTFSENGALAGRAAGLVAKWLQRYLDLVERHGG